MITVPEQFAHDTIHREGESGRQWIEQLPDLVAQMCQHWQLQLDGAVMHGYVGVVVPVRRGDEACVLKVQWLDPWTIPEPYALLAWQGRGAVRLLDFEPDKGALLLERLDASRNFK